MKALKSKLLLLCILVFGNKLLSKFVTNHSNIIEDNISEKSLNDSLQDAKLDPEIIDDDLKPIYPDMEDYCIDLSDILNLTPPGKSKFLSERVLRTVKD